MTSRRTYNDRCGIARALDVVGERWALLVVRELLLGPKRFTDLRAGLPGVGPDVLSQRLRDLEGAGLVERGKLPPPAASAVYSLTERGAALEPVVLELGRWGSAAPAPEGSELGPDALVIALKTLYAGAEFDGVVELRLGDAVFEVAVRDGVLWARRGEAEAPDLVIDSDTATLSAALFHGGSARSEEHTSELH